MKFSESSNIDVADALIALNAVPGMSTRFPAKILELGLEPARLFCMTPAGLVALSGISEKMAVNITAFPVKAFAVQERVRAAKAGVRIITFFEPDYPARLKQISDPPIVLYVKGRLPTHDEAMVAVVGVRDASLYGLKMAQQLGCRLAELGIGVVSGMARGIDTAAHQGVLKAAGYTIAVLGSGVDIAYPAGNQKLYQMIAENGCLISEFPLGFPVREYNFPRRNRIVSGLSLSTVVVEARARSGSLITAQFALDQGREVCAFPGPADSPVSLGAHELIRNGARLVLCAEDVLEGLPLRQEVLLAADNPGPAAPSFPAQTLEEKKVLTILKEGCFSLDSLLEKTGIPLSTLTMACLSLQLRGLLRERPGKLYELSEK